MKNRGIGGEKQQVDVKWGDIKMGQEYLHDDSVLTLFDFTLDAFVKRFSCELVARIIGSAI